MLEAQIVHLPDVPLPPEVARAKALHSKARFPTDDWQRTAYAWSLINDDKSILEVGSGQGHMVNALALTPRRRLATIDIKKHSLFERHGAYEQHVMDATRMTFADGEFDTVLCMEVLEHIPGDGPERALAELRRVAGKRLIVTVPFCEPEPISSVHAHRFSVDRIRKTFPNARLTMLMRERSATPWLMAEERFGELS